VGKGESGTAWPLDSGLTDNEKLAASLVAVGQAVPGGYQAGVAGHLDTAMKAVDALFTAHGLPGRDQLLAELALWKEHAQRGLVYFERCAGMIDSAVQSVSTREG
jgi:hypothetical protein